MRSASFKASSGDPTTPSEPGITGHLALFAIALARALSPSSSIVLADGPIKVNPQLSQIDANFAFSLRKPYPGWIASAPVISQAERR